MPSQAERRNATRSDIILAARDLFGSRGFAQVTIDDIATRARVAKGGLYHHFSSKEALFAEVLEAEQLRLAAQIQPSAQGTVVDLFTGAVRNYLIAASAPVTRQILLIDGPAVLGWTKWREIDERLFGATTHQAIRLIRGPAAAETEIAALAMLTLGAVMEAAMVCATSPKPEQSAHDAAAALRLLLVGLSD